MVAQLLQVQNISKSFPAIHLDSFPGTIFNDGNLFIKRYTHYQGAKYPDHGVSLETFAIDLMLEIESLSPLALLQPNDEVRHTEEWELIEGVATPANQEDELDVVAQKLIIG